MEEVLKALNALTKANKPEDPPKNEPPQDPAKQGPMEGVEATGGNGKRKNEAADPAGKAAKGAAAASAGA